MIAESRVAIETLARLSEDAFEGDPDQGLLGNLHDVHEGDWTALPAGAERSIAEVLEHVGWAKWMLRKKMSVIERLRICVTAPCLLYVPAQSVCCRI